MVLIVRMLATVGCNKLKKLPGTRPVVPSPYNYFGRGTNSSCVLFEFIRVATNPKHTGYACETIVFGSI